MERVVYWSEGRSGVAVGLQELVERVYPTNVFIFYGATCKT